MSINLSKIKEYITEVIEDELEEASVTGALDGGEGPPKTPYAFRGKKKKDKDKEDEISTNSTGYEKVNENSAEIDKNYMITRLTQWIEMLESLKTEIMMGKDK